MLPDTGLGVLVGRVGHQRHIIEPGNGLDGALVIFEAVLLVGIPPLVCLHHELEGALRNISPANQLQHVIAKGSLRGLELETESHLVHGEFQSTGGGAGQNAGDVMVENHHHIAHVGLVKGPTSDLLLKPAVDRLAPCLELGCISGDGAGGLPVIGFPDGKVGYDAPHLYFLRVILLFHRWEGLQVDSWEEPPAHCPPSACSSARSRYRHPRKSSYLRGSGSRWRRGLPQCSCSCSILSGSWHLPGADH